VHISYYDFDNASLKYATNATGSFVAITVDSSGDVGWFTSLAIDSSGKGHISYYDDSNNDLKYASSVIPLPAGKQSFIYNPTFLPVISTDPASSKPVGLGPVSTGGDTLNIKIGIDQFSGPVDIYGAYIASTNPQSVNILNPGGSSFSSFSINEILNTLSSGVPPAGVLPWMNNVTSPIDVTLLGAISASTLPSGTYSAYLLVTPAGSLNSYYLWITSFVIP
jgi:hypothetical protein